MFKTHFKHNKQEIPGRIRVMASMEGGGQFHLFRIGVERAPRNAPLPEVSNFPDHMCIQFGRAEAQYLVEHLTKMLATNNLPAPRTYQLPE